MELSLNSHLSENRKLLFEKNINCFSQMKPLVGFQRKEFKYFVRQQRPACTAGVINLWP